MCFVANAIKTVSLIAILFRVPEEESLFKGEINDNARISDAHYCACTEDGDEMKINCAVTDDQSGVCIDSDVQWER